MCSSAFLRWPTYSVLQSVRKGRPPWSVMRSTTVFAKFGLGDASTLDALRVNTRPVLLVHGGADNFVPTRMSRENYDACTAPKELYIVEGVGHAASYPEDPKTYQEKVLALFGRCEG